METSDLVNELLVKLGKAEAECEYYKAQYSILRGRLLNYKYQNRHIMQFALNNSNDTLIDMSTQGEKFHENYK